MTIIIQTNFYEKFSKNSNCLDTEKLSLEKKSHTVSVLLHLTEETEGKGLSVTRKSAIVKIVAWTSNSFLSCMNDRCQLQ